jgi:hypothetical protein
MLEDKREEQKQSTSELTIYLSIHVQVPSISKAEQALRPLTPLCLAAEASNQPTSPICIQVEGEADTALKPTVAFTQKTDSHVG